MGPLTFSVAGGHFRSAITSRSVDAFGNPIPWYTYPAVDFLKVLDLSDSKVAEFGSGHSTLWWASRAREVLAFEADADWFREISEKAKRSPNIDIKLVSSPTDCEQYFKPDYFDVVVVDGGSGLGTKGRAANAEIAFKNVRRTGLVIVDNTSADYCRPIIEIANNQGWLRVDLAGHAPGAAKRSCTSLFFKPEVNLLSHLAAPSFSQFRRAS